MTVAALPAVAEYAEDGVSTVFPVPFRFKTPDDLVVERLIAGIAQRLVLGSDYLVTGGSTDAGGTVTRIAASAGAVLRIRRRTARAQPMIYATGDRFPAKSHEDALDRGMLIEQEQDADIADVAARAIMLGEGETAGAVGLPSTRAGRLLGFDALGRLLLSSHQVLATALAPYLPLALRGVPGPPGGTAATMAQLKALGAALPPGDQVYAAFGRRPGWWAVRSGVPPVADPAEAYLAAISGTRYLERVRQPGRFHFDAWDPAADGVLTSASPWIVTGTDDLPKLRQAVAFMNAMGGGTLHLSDGVYAMLSAPLTGPNGAKAQLLWPNRTQLAGAATIAIEGAAPAGTYDSTIGGLAVHTTGAILLSNNTTAPVIGGDGTIFAGLGYQTAIYAVVRNLTVRVPPATGASGIDFFNCAWFAYDGVRVDTGTRTQDTPAPQEFPADTTKRTFGIRHAMPGNGNRSAAYRASVSGFYYAYWFGEHDRFDDLVAFACQYAAVWVGNNYPSKGKLLYSNCPYGVRFVGVTGANGASWVDIDLYTERLDPAYQPSMPAWQAPVADIDDAGNLAHGRATFWPTKGGVAGPHPGPNAIVVQGGFYLDTGRFDRGHLRQASLAAGGNLAVPNDADTAIGLTVAGEDNLDALTAAPNAQLVRLSKEGTYVATFQARFAANAGGGIRRLTVYKNIPGVPAIKIGEQVLPQVANVVLPLAVRVEVTATLPGLSLSAVVYQNSGAAQTVEQGSGSDAASIACRLVRVA